MGRVVGQGVPCRVLKVKLMGRGTRGTIIHDLNRHRVARGGVMGGDTGAAS